MLLFGALAIPCTAARAEPAPGSGEHRIEWRYPKFRPWEYSTVIGISLTALTWEIKSRKFSPPNERRGILFDDAIRDRFHSTSHDTRVRAGMVSDILWNTAEWYPLAVDSLLVPLVFDHGNTVASSQMLLMDWQVQALSFFLLRTGTHIIGRQRPSVPDCARDHEYEGSCDEPYASFFSGHAAMAFSGAALTCEHHAALAVYGSDAAGVVACVATMSMATAAGALRIVADRHWATDVLFGAGVGLGLGFGLPHLLHYGLTVRREDGGVQTTYALLPLASNTMAGLSVIALQ
ncbi:MAG: hypothetical protein NVSMB47_15440 [Polyangiales bacterium]